MSTDDDSRITPEVTEYIRNAIRHPREFEPLAYKPLSTSFDLESNSYSMVHEVSLEEVVTEMVARINTAEEAIREQVIVEYLRLHGWTVTKEESWRSSEAS